MRLPSDFVFQYRSGRHQLIAKLKFQNLRAIGISADYWVLNVGDRQPHRFREPTEKWLSKRSNSGNCELHRSNKPISQSAAMLPSGIKLKRVVITVSISPQSKQRAQRKRIEEAIMAFHSSVGLILLPSILNRFLEMLAS